MFKITHPAITNGVFDYKKSAVEIEFDSQEQAAMYEYNNLSEVLEKQRQKIASISENKGKVIEYKYSPETEKTTDDEKQSDLEENVSNLFGTTLTFFDQIDYKGKSQTLAIKSNNIFAVKKFEQPGTVGSFDADFFVFAVILVDQENNWNAYYFDQSNILDSWKEKVKKIYVCGASLMTILALIKIIK